MNNSKPESSISKPTWVNSIFYIVTQLLGLQPTIATHRSKLYSLFDDLRSFMKTFDPDYSLYPNTIQQICNNFQDSVNKIHHLVYACSSSHWTTSAVSWSHSSVYSMVQRVRADLSSCVSQFGCRSTIEFILAESELKAQDDVDILQLKSCLMDYQATLKDKQQTPQVQQVMNLISDRLRSIGPIDGVQDCNGLTVIPPFLPPHLNLVLHHNDFALGKKIGSGTFGCVYIGTMTGQTNASNAMKQVAVKVLNVNTLGGRQLETFKREVWTMATLNHPAILHLIGVTLTPPFCIVTELLKDSLYNKMRFLSPTKKSIIMMRVALGLAHLHAARIIHRDLKSSNILLDEDDNPRVCDFGLVGFLKEGTHTGFVGTTQWMAPELLRSSPFYNEKVDVYSFAVMMWELLTNQQPFTGMTQDQIVMAVIERGARPIIPPNVGPPQLVNFIQTMWSEDPNDRPSFEMIASMLMKPEYHFLGTNEETFKNGIPDLKLSSELVIAFDTSNWRKLDMLLRDITPDKTEEDPDLMPAVLSIFKGVDSERQAVIVHLLPSMVNLESFLSMKGYPFIVSLFRYTSIVVDEAADIIRTIDFSSKCLRQQRLISVIASSKNAKALNLLADLCKYEDIGTHVAKHDIPLPVQDNKNLGINSDENNDVLQKAADVESEKEIELAVLKVYESLLSHQSAKEFVKPIKQPLVIASLFISNHPEIACNVIATFPLDEEELQWECEILPLVADASENDYSGLIALHKLFVVIPVEHLLKYKELIEKSITNHLQFYKDENLISKLSSFTNIPTKLTAEQIQKQQEQIQEQQQKQKQKQEQEQMQQQKQQQIYQMQQKQMQQQQQQYQQQQKYEQQKLEQQIQQMQQQEQPNQQYQYYQQQYRQPQNQQQQQYPQDQQQQFQQQQYQQSQQQQYQQNQQQQYQQNQQQQYQQSQQQQYQQNQQQQYQQNQQQQYQQNQQQQYQQNQQQQYQQNQQQQYQQSQQQQYQQNQQQQYQQNQQQLQQNQQQIQQNQQQMQQNQQQMQQNQQQMQQNQHNQQQLYQQNQQQIHQNQQQIQLNQQQIQLNQQQMQQNQQYQQQMQPNQSSQQYQQQNQISIQNQSSQFQQLDQQYLGQSSQQSSFSAQQSPRLQYQQQQFQLPQSPLQNTQLQQSPLQQRPFPFQQYSQQPSRKDSFDVAQPQKPGNEEEQLIDFHEHVYSQMQPPYQPPNNVTQHQAKTLQESQTMEDDPLLKF